MSFKCVAQLSTQTIIYDDILDIMRASNFEEKYIPFKAKQGF